MPTVSELTSKNIGNAITNVKTWGGIVYNVKDYGAKTTDEESSFDSTSEIQSAIDAAKTAGKGVVAFPSGTYLISENLILSSNIVLLFFDAEIKLTQNTTTGAIITNVYNGGVGITNFTENISIINARINGNNILNENAFGFINCQNITIHNPEVRNVKHEIGGGKAFQFELGDNGVKDCNVYNPVIYDSSIGCNAQGIPGKPAVNINFYNVTMENVDIPFNFDSQSGTGTSSREEMSVTVDGFNLRNCGKITGTYGSASGGGIITGDRAFGVTVKNGKVVNDSIYGEIGGLIHGKLKECVVENIEVDATLTALFNGKIKGFGNPAGTAIPAIYYARNIKCYGAINYVVQAFDTTTGHMTNCRLDNIEVNTVNNGIVDANAAAISTCTATIRRKDQLKGFVDATFPEINQAGNALDKFDNTGKSVYSEIFHTKTNVANNTATPLFEIALPPGGRIFIEFFMTTSFVSSSASAAGRTIKGVISAVSNGNGVIASNVSASLLDASSLITATSQTLVASITNDETNDKIVFNVTQSNSSSVAETVTVHAWTHYSLDVTPKKPNITYL